MDSRTSAVVVDVAGASPSPGGSVPLGTRMSNWWSSLVAEGPREESRWARRQAEAGRGLLTAARQKAVGGVRYLLDGEAQPETREDVWVRGVVHRFEGEALEWPGSCECRYFGLRTLLTDSIVLIDLASTVWCTYRSQYAPITALPEIIPSPESYRSQRLTRIPSEEPRTSPWQWMTSDRAGLTTDAGWGCMLRTGQSLLANALVHQHLGRGESPRWRDHGRLG